MRVGELGFEAGSPLAREVRALVVTLRRSPSFEATAGRVDGVDGTIVVPPDLDLLPSEGGPRPVDGVRSLAGRYLAALPGDSGRAVLSWDWEDRTLGIVASTPAGEGAEHRFTLDDAGALLLERRPAPRDGSTWSVLHGEPLGRDAVELLPAGAGPTPHGLDAAEAMAARAIDGAIVVWVEREEIAGEAPFSRGAMLVRTFRDAVAQPGYADGTADGSTSRGEEGIRLLRAGFGVGRGPRGLVLDAGIAEGIALGLRPGTAGEVIAAMGANDDRGEARAARARDLAGRVTSGMRERGR